MKTIVTPTFIDAISRSVEVDGVTVQISTADIDQILQLVGYTDPLQGELARAPAAVVAALSGDEIDAVDKLAITTWLLGLVGRHREALKSIVAICTGQPVEWIGKLLPDRFLTLLLMSVEVNVDFFIQALPALNALAGRLAPGGVTPAQPTAPASTGPAPSSN